MATSIVSFPQPGISPSSVPAQSGIAAALQAPSQSLQVSTPQDPRYRGLHLVVAGSRQAAVSPRSHRQTGPDSSQAQANRIVAQVEREIARQASTQRQLRLHGRAPAAQQSLPVVEIESPASIARRLFAALLSFARPA